MQNGLSEELFGRISTLTNTLKLQTISFLNEVSAPKEAEPGDSDSEESVIFIEGPEDVENNPFVSLLRERQASIADRKKTVEEACERSCSKVSLEDLVTLSVALHGSIEDSIDSVCASMGMKEEEIESMKTHLDDSVPASLFKSNVKDKVFGKVIDGPSDPATVPLSTTLFEDPEHGQDSPGAELECFEVNMNQSLGGHPNKPVFSVNNLATASKKSDIQAADLNYLGLSEETRKLLGLES